MEMNSLPSKYQQSEWKKMQLIIMISLLNNPVITQIKNKQANKTPHNAKVFIQSKIIDNAEGEGPARVWVGVQTEDVIS